MIHDLYLRAHVVLPCDEGKQTKTAKGARWAKVWPQCALVLDTETTLDLEQSLTFGVWRFCKLQGTEYVAILEGIFHRDGLAKKDIQTIRAYSKKHLANGLTDGADRKLSVSSRSEFVKDIFWESVRAGALIVGFNLPFDISRIAARWTVARNGGFSFVLSQLSRKRVENRHRPRIRIAPLNGVAELFELTAVKRKSEQSNWRRGRFLDLHTLGFALTDNSYSLAGAIESFGSEPKKMEYEPTGKSTDRRNHIRAPRCIRNARIAQCTETGVRPSSHCVAT